MLIRDYRTNVTRDALDLEGIFPCFMQLVAFQLITRFPDAYFNELARHV